MNIPTKCPECGHEWDMHEPNIFPDHGNKHKLFIYFHCSNTLCTRVLYTEIFVWDESTLWMSGNLKIDFKQIKEIEKNGHKKV
jgi:hypothetical protein